MNGVFLDWAATSPVVRFPIDTSKHWRNPNAAYAYEERKVLTDCENRIKAAIGAKGGKVVFGGTSSQLVENLFTHIYDETNEYLTICSVYEHDSIWRFADQWGNIDSLKHAIQTYHGDKQLIICLMGVNNLTGGIFPVVDIGNACHQHNAFYICDMTAMIGKAPIPPNIDQWCDCAVWSGHKLGTELGIGAMWISDRLDKWLNGFKLHGTPNLAGALALTQAVEGACDISSIEDKNVQWMDLSDELYSRLLDVCTDVKQIGNNEGCWAINAIRLPRFNADALQQHLASKQIYVSIGGSASKLKQLIEDVEESVIVSSDPFGRMVIEIYDDWRE